MFHDSKSGLIWGILHASHYLDHVWVNIRWLEWIPHIKLIQFLETGTTIQVESILVRVRHNVFVRGNNRRIRKTVTNDHCGDLPTYSLVRTSRPKSICFQGCWLLKVSSTTCDEEVCFWGKSVYQHGTEMTFSTSASICNHNSHESDAYEYICVKRSKLQVDI